MKLYKNILIAICTLVFMACQTAAPSVSPTEVFKAQNEARKKKDGATMKANLSKVSIELMDKTAKTLNKSVEEILVMEPAGVKAPENFEYRNEKIEGDTATVEVRTAGIEQWSIVPFVKEDGRWKIALDKLIEDAKQAMQESMENSNTAITNTVNTNAANTNSTNTSSTNTNSTKNKTGK
jgi:hypothetical protein